MSQDNFSKQNKLELIIIGIACAALYAIMNYIKYTYFSGHVAELSMAAMVNFVIFLVVLFLIGQYSIKKNKGVFEIKKVFQALFLVIIVAEMGNVLMNYIYPFYINPDFFDQFYDRNVIALKEINKNMSDENRELVLENIKNMKATGPKDLFTLYLREIVFDSIFAFVTVFILKFLNKPVNPIILNPKQDQ